jgi:nitrate reductase gamma subunit
MGQSGAIAILILLFLAVTSACSAEQIAVSSVLTFDVYAVYINPHPTEKQILWSSHACILGYSIFMGAIATAFHYIGVSMGYLYELMGTMIGSAVVPIALCITWRKCNGTGAVVGAIIGFVAAIAGWIGITSKLNDGVIDVNTTFGDYEMLTGNLLAIGVGGLITVGWSLLRPENFDWDITRAINAKPEHTVDGLARASDSSPTSNPDSPSAEVEDKDVEGLKFGATPRLPKEVEQVEEQPSDMSEDQAGLEKAFKFASYAALSLTAILIFVSFSSPRRIIPS